jgi:hypothetical protein
MNRVDGREYKTIKTLPNNALTFEIKLHQEEINRLMAEVEEHRAAMRRKTDIMECRKALGRKFHMGGKHTCYVCKDGTK